MQFYNLKSKQKVDIANELVELVEMPNGRMAATTESEGMKLFKFLGKADVETLLAMGKTPTKQEKKVEG